LELALLIVTIYSVVNLATARAIVEGSSMEPNFETSQLVIVSRLFYFFTKPQRGDVVVLHDPENVSVDFIKRVVGLPGEYVEIDHNGRVYINGVELSEPYIEPDRWCKICAGHWQLNDNQYFVLGDNRANSHDSSKFGPLDQNLIVGQAWFRYWPFDKIGMIPHERYVDTPSTFVPPTPTITPTPRPRVPRTPRPGPTSPMIQQPAMLDQS
jgi:signal peptidase I